ncbi:MAG: DUF2118 domain-containing protein [Thermoprotei archaeon]
MRTTWNDIEYAFPEIFVENTDSSNYIVELESGVYVLAKTKPSKYTRFFGHIIYEKALEYVDLTAPLIKNSMIIVPKFSGSETKGILVEKGIKPCLAEIRGYKPLLTIREGSSVNEGDKIAYIITGKGEVRTYRSPCSGVLVLAVNIVWEKPEKYILVFVGKNDAREITIRENP